LRKSLIPCVLLCFVFLFLLLPTVYAGDITIDVYIPAVFKYDEDGRWRCYANITIQNLSEENITLSWVCVSLINITFVDETSEELSDLAGYNFTVNLKLKPGNKFILHMTATEFGFDKEPKIIWIRLESSYLEATKSVTMILPIIPEFSSILILLLFMMATLLASCIRTKEK